MPSTTVHARYVTTATRLIDKHGRALVLLVPSSTGPASRPVITWAEEAIVGVVTSYSLAETDGQLIQQNDKQILVAAIAGTTAITNAMRIRDGAIDYPIVSVAELQPGNTAILYTVQVRL